MSVDFFHECEVKYRVQDADERHAWEELVERRGFTRKDRHLETDFVPDTSDFRCRQAGLLVRFRRVLVERTADNDIILTMKVKGTADEFQEYFELEYPFSNVNESAYTRVNSLLQQTAGVTLPRTIHAYDPAHFEQLLAVVRVVLPAHRILLEKKRTTYVRDDCHVLFDMLPEGIGEYVEVEASSPQKLRLLMRELSLPDDRIEPLDYGAILMRHKSGLPEHEARTGLFIGAEWALYKIYLAEQPEPAALSC